MKACRSRYLSPGMTTLLHLIIARAISRPRRYSPAATDNLCATALTVAQSARSGRSRCIFSPMSTTPEDLERVTSLVLQFLESKAFFGAERALRTELALALEACERDPSALQKHSLFRERAGAVARHRRAYQRRGRVAHSRLYATAPPDEPDGCRAGRCGGRLRGQ